MVKNILVVTDFSVKSLHILKWVLQEKEKENSGFTYSFILISGYDNGSSIRDLLFNTKGKIYSKIRSEEFLDACAIIKNKYANLIHHIRFDLFTGSLQRTFDLYLKINKIDEAYYGFSGITEKKTNNQFNLAPFLERSKVIDAQEIVIDFSVLAIPEEGKTAEIFAEG